MPRPHRDLDDILAQLDGSEPYYLRALVVELRQLRDEHARLLAERDARNREAA